MVTFSIIQKSQLEGGQRIDPEYYQPEYLRLVNDLIQTNSYKSWNDIKGKFITGPFGSEFNVENYITDGKYRYIRGKDVKEFIIADNDNVYIPEKDFGRLKKYSLDEGDILTSVVGTLGIAAIVNKSSLPAIFSCKSTAFRTNDINPYYFITYLNSKYGHNLLLRSMRGHVQVGLNIWDLKSLLVFIPLKEEQEKIGELFLSSQELLNESKLLYDQAEKLLLQELGLVDFQIPDDLAFVVNFSDVKNASRIDADYFQPKYEKLVLKLKSQNAKPLLEVIKNVTANFNPSSKPDEPFKYVELANINASIGTIDGYSEVLGREAPGRAKRVLATGDVIVSSVEGSLGKVALVDEEQKGYLASTGFFQFRSDEILPEVLLVLAKSMIFHMQLEKETAGTILTAVPKDAIKNIFVPVLSMATQQKIADLVRQSHEARKKSKEFLEEAKRKVEEMIEKGESN